MKLLCRIFHSYEPFNFSHRRFLLFLQAFSFLLLLNALMKPTEESDCSKKANSRLQKHLSTEASNSLCYKNPPQFPTESRGLTSNR
ncbi:hypothetical protein MRB53_032864 [Persea americana]|uniref:Uncharacterized protein n=1 Tax=Persea americana TaxID=3435 RepID=A0ACC2KT29_PERAE|nr:hypothetical protein MRB53_032864 [Persea americana]